MDEREHVTEINNNRESQVSAFSKQDTLIGVFDRANTSIKSGSVIDGLSKSIFAAESSFKVNFKSIISSFKSTPALAEVGSISKVASGISTSIKSGSVIDGLPKSVFAAENSFKAPSRSLVSAFESTRALSEASGLAKRWLGG